MQILSVGRNYRAHVAEMQSAVPKEPLWFWKPETSIIGDGGTILLPRDVGAIHHEVELALRIGARSREVDAFTVAIDVTARDLQSKAKQNGHPWAKAKGFDTFLPLGSWVPADGVDLQALQIHLAVDGITRQDGNTRDMMWPIPALLEKAAEWVTLRPGDMLLTGTPQGVGPILDGDTLEAEVVDHASLRVRAAWRD